MHDFINKAKEIILNSNLSASKGFAFYFQTACVALLMITKLRLRILLRDRTALFLFLMPKASTSLLYFSNNSVLWNVLMYIIICKIVFRRTFSCNLFIIKVFLVHLYMYKDREIAALWNYLSMTSFNTFTLRYTQQHMQVLFSPWKGDILIGIVPLLWYCEFRWQFNFLQLILFANYFH